MATQNSTASFPSLFPQTHRSAWSAPNFGALTGHYRQSLPACEYEHEYGMCGRIAKVTDLDSERRCAGCTST
jgi:hypothetical protein